MQRPNFFPSCFSKSLLASLVIAFLGSCSSTPPPETSDPQLQHDLDQDASRSREIGFSYWNDVPEAGSLRVKIDLSDQAAYFYRGDTIVGRSRVATGISTHRTPTGSFKITEKTADKRSNLYGRIYGPNGNVVNSDADSRKSKIPSGGRFLGAAMPHWMRLTSYGIGMHAGPIPRPGSPASHGCIRLPNEMAVSLFNKVSIGTPVSIVP